ncbi:hypothetical protein ACFS07_16075 [Undibacterium arcticum]
MISLPPREVSSQPLQPQEINQLRLHARRIWRFFFSTFVGEEDHWLPPDNFQEDPHPVVAHRSSPTNFGLYLLSVIAARDFGWIGILDMADRLESTLKTLHSLPRYRGHFFTIGTTLAICGPSIRNIFLLSIAAIWQGIFSLCRRGVRNFRGAPFSVQST